MTENKPNPIELKAIETVLRVDRNRWFIACLCLVFLCCIILFMTWQSFKTAQNNKEIIYVKLAPNGTWETSNFSPQDGQIYFKTTIDSLLAQYVDYRYSLNPVDIADNYGNANQFMDGNLAANFLSKNGFNAAQKAADIIANPGNETIEVLWRFNQHYDQIEGYFNGQKSEVIKTNIYFFMSKTVRGSIQDKIPYRLVLDWHLMPIEELKKQSLEFLKINPIGLKIISEILYIEPILKNEVIQ